MFDSFNDCQHLKKIVKQIIFCILLIVCICCHFLLALKKKSSVVSLDPDGLSVEVGDQVLVAGQKNGTVRFYGKTDFAPGGSAARAAMHLIDIHSVWPPCTRRCADQENFEESCAAL